MKEVTMSQILQEVILQAMEQGRLTSGVHDCAHLLEIDPFNVMLCVLPGEPALSSQDVSLNIHHMLIEAFCREYEIRLVKVDSVAKLSELVKGRASNPDNCAKVSRKGFADTTCLILQYPEDGTSEEDETFAEYYKSGNLSDTSTTCIIALPD